METFWLIEYDKAVQTTCEEFRHLELDIVKLLRIQTALFELRCPLYDDLLSLETLLTDADSTHSKCIVLSISPDIFVLGTEVPYQILSHSKEPGLYISWSLCQTCELKLNSSFRAKNRVLLTGYRLRSAIR